ncbi:hypothetical protein ASD92_25990 [Massilia sp. Root1485]|nr:hypothetical protein ASD92_25990 [Massilia sp. Root1485]
MRVDRSRVLRCSNTDFEPLYSTCLQATQCIGLNYVSQPNSGLRYVGQILLHTTNVTATSVHLPSKQLPIRIIQEMIFFNNVLVFGQSNWSFCAARIANVRRIVTKDREHAAEYLTSVQRNQISELIGNSSISKVRMQTWVLAQTGKNFIDRGLALFRDASIKPDAKTFVSHTSSKL